jgi:hypothetical protein
MKTAFMAVVITLGLMAGVSGKDVRPTVEYAKVTFTSPVRVINAVLMGDYLIEHDNDRMARGGPCTYIYKMRDRSKPVVTFHCKHLNRATTAKATVRLQRTYDMGSTLGYVMTEFQFENSADSHGVPLSR